MLQIPLQRKSIFERVRASLMTHRVTVLVGPRQCGKTWLSRQLADHHFDADHPVDQARLAGNPVDVLRSLDGVILIDEVQQMPELFPAIRVAADEPHPNRVFLLTGSASPQLMGHAAHRLTGRMKLIEMSGFDLSETGHLDYQKLWLRGGFPLSFLAENDPGSYDWRTEFIMSYLRNELPTLAETRLAPRKLYNFLLMLAHCHGQTKHQKDIANALQLDVRTVNRHFDIFAGAFLLRELPAFEQNMGKRLRKTPKTYLRDTGLLHALSNISSLKDLRVQPRLFGSSWEGFGIEQVLRILGIPDHECFYWRTQGGAELDLLVVKGNKRWGFEFKASEIPTTSRSMHSAIQDLHLERLIVIHQGADTLELTPSILAVGVHDLPRLQDFL